MAKGGENIPTPGMPNPAGNIFLVEAGPLEDRAGVTRGESGNFRSEKISQEAVFVIEAKMVAVGGLEVGGASNKPDLALGGGGLLGENGGGGAVAKEAGADENAGVIVEVGGSGANFHANDENVVGLTRGKEGGGLLKSGKSGAAAEADEIEKGERGGETEALGEVAGEAGAEVASAGGHEEGVDLVEFEA